MHTEDSVSFSCHINISSGWEYLWYKGENQLTVSGNNHTIKSVVTSDSGSYRCQAKRGKDTVFKSDQSQGVKLIIEGTFFFTSLLTFFLYVHVLNVTTLIVFLQSAHRLM